MSSYKVGRVIADNFGPFINFDFDFARPGLTLVEGQIEGVPGCDSNGSGKSFLFDAPTWCLFDRCLRPQYTGDSVIRNDSTGGCRVSTELLGGPVPLTVVRYRKHRMHKDILMLFVDGVDVTRGTNAQTQLAIEQHLGLDYTGYINSLAFGARDDVKSFFAAPDSERKKVLDKILGLELFAAAQEIATKDLRASAVDLNAAEISVAETVSAISEQTAVFEALSTNADAETLKTDIATQKLRIAGLSKKETAACDKLSKANEAHAIENDKALEVQAAYDAKVTALAKSRSDLQSKLATLSRDEGAKESTAAALLRAKTRVLDKAGKECPECQQPVPAKHVHSIADKLSSEYDAATAAHAAVKAATAAIRASLAKLVDPPEPRYHELGVTEEAVNAAQASYDDIVSSRELEKARLDEMMESSNRNTAQINDAKNRLSELRVTLCKKQDAVATLHVTDDNLRFWVEGFGNSGVKSFLIESEIPEINRRASIQAQRLLGNGAYVRLSATKELKNKSAIREELTVQACIPGYTTSYAGASKGQKRRLDLALLLAFRDIIGSRSAKSFHQLFADELFDGVDKSGCEAVGQLLREISQEIPVLLVTHSSYLKRLGDRIVTIHHSDGCARIVEGSSVLVARSAASDTKGPVRKGPVKRAK